MSRIAEPSPQGQNQNQQDQKNPARSKLVQRLLDASSSLPNFLNDLLTTQAVLVAGTEAACFLVERQGDQVNLKPLHHIRPDDSDQDTRAAALKAFANLMQPCVVQVKDGAIDVGQPDGGEPQFCLVTVLRGDGQVVAVNGVITRCRDMERARQRLTSMQLVAGYFDLFVLRRAAERDKAIADRHQHVLQYAGAIATAEGFESAAMNFCNELATRTGASRVSIGWVKANGKDLRVKALSHTEKFDKKQELIIQLERVMEECMDQEEPVRFDPDGTSSPNVTRMARALSVAQGGHIVASTPLRRRDEVVGVLCVEFPPKTVLDSHAEAAMAVAAELTGPMLFDRHENDRNIFIKIGHSIKGLAEKAVGPKHMGVKMIIVAAVLVIGFVTLYKPMYHVRGGVEFVAQETRSICSPSEGRLEKVFVKPGQSVRAGTLLAKMNTDELDIRLLQSKAQAQVKEREADARRGEGKTGEQRVAESERDAALREAALYTYLIEQASIKAPIDGVILKGDLVDKQNAPVKQGDVLFEMAKADPSDPDHVAIEVKSLVSERDIQFVKKVFDEQRSGAMPKRDFDGLASTTSFPGIEHHFRITRIVPVGQPKEGENVFEVYGELTEPQAIWMHPGLAGEVRIDIEKRRFAWIWTHRLTDWLQLKLWL